MKKNIILKLIKKKITISVAESCTGGLLACEIIAIPKTSKIFNLGLVTYSNKAKEMVLKVKKKKLIQFGAVSPQICKNMVENLYIITKSKLCIATTGIAGPGGGSKLKPVGLVYIGIKFKKKTKIYMYNFKKSLKRKQIQKLTVNKVFSLIKSII